MRVKVLFFEPLRALVGSRRIAISLDEGARVADLLGRLGQEYGEGLREKLEDSPTLRIIVNGRDVDLLGGAEATLRSGDEVVFLTAVGGGLRDLG